MSDLLRQRRFFDEQMNAIKDLKKVSVSKDTLEIYPNDKRKFWKKVNVVAGEGCWNWLGGKDSSGYGCYSIAGKAITASRLAYILKCGEIPDGMSVLHRCDNGACVNPDHLFLGTHQDNMNDMVSKRMETKYVGVCKSATAEKWTATIYLNKKVTYVGTFESDKEAAMARDRKVIEHNLPYVLNFPHLLKEKGLVRPPTD